MKTGAPGAEPRDAGSGWYISSVRDVLQKGSNRIKQYEQPFKAKVPHASLRFYCVFLFFSYSYPNGSIFIRYRNSFFSPPLFFLSLPLSLSLWLSLSLCLSPSIHLWGKHFRRFMSCRLSQLKSLVDVLTYHFSSSFTESSKMEKEVLLERLILSDFTSCSGFL